MHWPEEAGIASHSKFTTTFKNITGVSPPSEFIKFIAKMKISEFFVLQTC